MTEEQDKAIDRLLEYYPITLMPTIFTIEGTDEKYEVYPNIEQCEKMFLFCLKQILLNK